MKKRKKMIVCPECGSMVSYNSYFKRYLCICGWECEKCDDKHLEDITKEETFDMKWEEAMKHNIFKYTIPYLKEACESVQCAEHIVKACILDKDQDITIITAETIEKEICVLEEQIESLKRNLENLDPGFGFKGWGWEKKEEIEEDDD